MPPAAPAFLSDARVLAAYFIFAGSYFVFAPGQLRRLLPHGLPVTVATIVAGSVWLWAAM